MWLGGGGSGGVTPGQLSWEATTAVACIAQILSVNWGLIAQDVGILLKEGALAYDCCWAWNRWGLLGDAESRTWAGPWGRPGSMWG